MHLRAKVSHFKNHTNNRIEYFFGKFKDGVSSTTSMAECIQMIVKTARRREKSTCTGTFRSAASTTPATTRRELGSLLYNTLRGGVHRAGVHGCTADARRLRERSRRRRQGSRGVRPVSPASSQLARLALRLPVLAVHEIAVTGWHTGETERVDAHPARVCGHKIHRWAETSLICPGLVHDRSMIFT